MISLTISDLVIALSPTLANIESFISVLGEEKEKTQRDVGKKLNHILTTITLESLTRAELDELMKKLRDELKKSEEK